METKVIGIVTGGAGGEIDAASREGIDTYITGEAPHWAVVAAEELGIVPWRPLRDRDFRGQGARRRTIGTFNLPWEFLTIPLGYQGFFARWIRHVRAFRWL